MDMDLIRKYLSEDQELGRNLKEAKIPTSRMAEYTPANEIDPNAMYRPKEQLKDELMDYYKWSPEKAEAEMGKFGAFGNKIRSEPIDLLDIVLDGQGNDKKNAVYYNPYRMDRYNYYRPDTSDQPKYSKLKSMLEKKNK